MNLYLFVTLARKIYFVVFSERPLNSKRIASAPLTCHVLGGRIAVTVEHDDGQNIETHSRKYSACIVIDMLENVVAFVAYPLQKNQPEIPLNGIW